MSVQELEKIDWKRNELIPTIVQDYGSKEVLMLAYSSYQSLETTLQTRFAHYFSRSKQRIWQKGEHSGHTQHVMSVRYDCDADSLLFVVEQNGVACHTGEMSCFYREIGCTDSKKTYKLRKEKKSIYDTLDELSHIIESKRLESSSVSYTASLLAKGENAVCKKIVEEAGELCFALKDKEQESIIYECADLLYHILVGLSLEHISIERVYRELRRRMGQSGLEEKASRIQA